MTSVVHAIRETPLPSVASVMRSRMEDRSQPLLREDPYHLALVIECGGMRGAAAGGLVQALLDAGTVGCFDTIHGSSAGACAAAYFVAEQATEGRAIFHDDICNRAVVNPYRFFARPCMVDTDFIVDRIIAERRRLNFDKIAAAAGRLCVLTSCVETGRPAVHNSFPTFGDLCEALRASLRVPGPRERGVVIDGLHHLDGGLLASIPIELACSAGATHILVLGTRRIGDYGRISPTLRLEAALLRFCYGAKFAAAYNASCLNAWPRSDERAKGFAAVEMLARPDCSPECHWHTIDQGILQRVGADAEAVGRTFLDVVRHAPAL